jgi:outer membrane lipoprotein-sorting protein
MKKLLFFLTGLFITVVINAQSLDQIVKNHSAAVKQDKLAKISSIRITGKMSAMGMEMPMVMIMKNPDKIKVTYSISGQEMISVFDGEKGFMVNPMMGSTNPIELTGEQLKQVQNNNIYQNQIVNYFKNKKLTLEGQESINNKPAYKIKVNNENSPIYLYLDKESYLLVRMSTNINQGGKSVNTDTYMSDYIDINDVVLPKKTIAMMNGIEAVVISFDKIEVNIPIDDDIFKLE